jgi:hypothetical protein
MNSPSMYIQHWKLAHYRTFWYCSFSEVYLIYMTLRSWLYSHFQVFVIALTLSHSWRPQWSLVDQRRMVIFLCICVSFSSSQSDDGLRTTFLFPLWRTLFSKVVLSTILCIRHCHKFNNSVTESDYKLDIIAEGEHILPQKRDRNSDKKLCNCQFCNATYVESHCIK